MGTLSNRSTRLALAAYKLSAIAIPALLVFQACFLYVLVSGNPSDTQPVKRDYLKHEKLHFFYHDALNFTDFIVLRGLGGIDTPLTSPFGTMFCFNDIITEGPELDSKPLGTFVGTSIVTSFDGFTFFTSFTITLNTTKNNGSLSFMGPVDSRGLSTSIPIVGGMGDFLFAEGSVMLNPYNVSTFNITYTVDIDAYWPLYGQA